MRALKLLSALTTSFLLFTLSVQAEAPADSEASSWNQWRGPNRDGRVEGPTWPQDLGSVSTSWRIDLGASYSGPIVAADRVFVTEELEGKEGVRALDRKTGEQLWKVEWSGEGSVPFFAKRNGDWIRSTPAYDGKTLFVGGMNEYITAIDGATGKVIWSIDVPKTFETKIPSFGFSSSPLVDGDALYLQAANSLLKLNKSTGALIWRSLESGGEMTADGAFSSPVIATLHGERQLIVQTRAELVGVSIEDGSVLWNHAVPSFRGMNILTPSPHGNGVFTSTERNRSFFYSVEAAGEQMAAKEVWTSKAQAYMSSPILHEGHAYLHLGNGRMACLNLATGEETWRSEAFGDYWSMAIQGDRILALDQDGSLHLVRANPERFELIDSKEVGQQETWGYLAVDRNQLFVRELKGLVALEWDVSSETAQASPPAEVSDARPARKHEGRISR